MSNSKLDHEIALYTARTPRSRILQQQGEQYLPGGSSRATVSFDPYPPYMDHGQGHHMYDVDGNQYLDFMLNATSLIMGHAHPAITNALQNQLTSGTAFGAPTHSQIRLAKLISDRIPSIDTLRFTNSGTEATLMAIRAARAFTNRPMIAKFEGGYHGSHEFVEISVRPQKHLLDPLGPTSIPEFPGQPASIAANVLTLPYNDLEQSASLIEQYRDDLACVVMEPIVSNFGYVPANLQFLEGIRTLTKQHNIVLIFDEVQSARVGSGGAQERFNVIPDITTLGKTIGGGMAVGAFGGRQDIMELYGGALGGPVIPHAGTFNANPMTMVAGETVLESLDTSVYERLDHLGDILRIKLRTVFEELGVDAQITGVSSFFGIHFTSDAITNYRSMVAGNRDMNKALFLGLLNEGIFLQTAAAGSLSTLTTESDIDTLVEAVQTVIQRIR